MHTRPTVDRGFYGHCSDLKEVCLCQRTKQITFWEIGVGLWSTAHFVSNSGGSRGGAWEAWAPLLFLDQTEAAPEGPKNFFRRLPPPPLISGSG